MNKNKYLLLERGRHFTLTALATHLNKIHNAKKSQNPFGPADTHKYITRGHLPEYLGGNILTEIRDEVIGIKLIQIEDEVHETFKGTNNKGLNS